MRSTVEQKIDHGQMRHERPVRLGIGRVHVILEGYADMGMGSFNFIVFSAPFDAKFPFFSLHAKMISRPYPAAVYTNDTGPFERLCDVWVIDTMPELVAKGLATFF